MYLEDGQLRPVDHRDHPNDIIPSFTLGSISFEGRNWTEAGQVVLEAGCMVPQAFRDVEPTVQCVERFGDGDFRAHFGYTNRGSRVDRLTPGTPWNSFSPQPTDRGQGAIYQPGDHPDTVQVEFTQGETRIEWTLGTTTVAAVLSGEGATRRCQASITVVKELHAPVGGRFNLLIDGEIAGTGANVGDGGTTGTVSVSAAPGGTTHRVDESGAGNTVLGRYETSIRCVWRNRTTPDRLDETGHALSISVRDGDEVVCTIVNERQVGPVIPIAECVQPLDQAAGTYVAQFGWDSRNAYPVDIDYGPRNNFDPAPDDRDQPTDFAEGRHRNVFSVAFTGSSLTWKLDGASATATPSTRLCEPLPPTPPTPTPPEPTPPPTPPTPPPTSDAAPHRPRLRRAAASAAGAAADGRHRGDEGRVPDDGLDQRHDQVGRHGAESLDDRGRGRCGVPHRA